MKIKQILLSNGTVVEKAFPTKIEEVTSIYALGLDVVEEKERLYKAIRLAPTDMRYNEFVKYRKAWVKEIIELETLYKNVCYAYHNEPLPEVMARKNEFFTVGGVAL
ncbi:hypothetical protein HONESTABE_280 [Bacillus phage HonestAbe]|nr:hypothetical protein HONESTABE_280 [Bacillus phage HonestAbe]